MFLWCCLLCWDWRTSHFLRPNMNLGHKGIKAPNPYLCHTTKTVHLILHWLQTLPLDVHYPHWKSSNSVNSSSGVNPSIHTWAPSAPPDGPVKVSHSAHADTGSSSLEFDCWFEDRLLNPSFTVETPTVLNRQLHDMMRQGAVCSTQSWEDAADKLTGVLKQETVIKLVMTKRPIINTVAVSWYILHHKLSLYCIVISVI